MRTGTLVTLVVALASGPATVLAQQDEPMTAPEGNDSQNLDERQPQTSDSGNSTFWDNYFYQPPAGSYQLQQPLAGTYELEQPLAGTYQLQQPLAGTYQLQQPLVGTYQLQQPLAGTYQLQQPLVGTYQLQQPLMGTQQRRR